MQNPGSRKVADFFAHHLATLEDAEVEIVDLHELDLPIWKESFWSGNEELNTVWQPAKESLESADAYVMISPEYSGMASHHLKNFILYVGKSMAHKPALLVGVSSGRGGAYPISELRSSSHKNTFINYIPEHIIVREVKNVLEAHALDKNLSEADEYIKRRSVQAIKTLNSYAQAFVAIRKEGEYDFETYSNGM